MSETTSAGSSLRPLMIVILILSILELHLYRLPLAGLSGENGSGELLSRIVHPWGTVTHGIATTLAATAMILTAARFLWEPLSGKRSRRLPLVLVMALIVASIFQLAAGNTASMVTLQSISFLLAGYMAASFLFQRQNLSDKIIVILFAAYQLYARAILAGNAPLLSSAGGSPVFSLPPLIVVELIMIVAILALVPAYISRFWRISRGSKIRAVAIASAVAAMLVKFYLADTSGFEQMIKTMSGTSLNVPMPLYILTVWIIIFTAITLRASKGRSRYMGYALVFIFLSGFMLVDPFQHLLSGLGFTLLGMNESLESA